MKGKVQWKHHNPITGSTIDGYDCWKDSYRTGGGL